MIERLGVPVVPSARSGRAPPFPLCWMGEVGDAPMKNHWWWTARPLLEVGSDLGAVVGLLVAAVAVGLQRGEPSGVLVE